MYIQVHVQISATIARMQHSSLHWHTAALSAGLGGGLRADETQLYEGILGICEFT